MSNVVWHSAAATTSAPHITRLNICANIPRKNARAICGSSEGMTVFLKTKISVRKPLQCVLSSFGTMLGSAVSASSSSSSSSILPPTFCLIAVRAAAAMEVNGPVIDAAEDALLRLGAGLAGVDGVGISPAATFSSSRAHASSRAFACKAASATGAAARARWICSLVDSRALDSNSEESATRDSDALVSSCTSSASRWASSAFWWICRVSV
mmetsp:Transcript_8428/g.37233  ORF Transcript_8428/g.37233 Transcript_8428/m.37233 type:complete len:211 (-) Transcript_8428:2087-2719(-)